MESGMDIRQITDDFAVSPQITPEDVARIAEAGFVRVICNRPDSEVAEAQGSAAIKAACARHGLEFRLIPVDHSGLTSDLVAAQAEAVNTAEGPVFAYCRSGTRCCHVWALARAGDMETEDILRAGARGGYDLTPLRPAIEAMAERG